MRMSGTILIGILLVFGGLGFITFITFRSRSIIERIAKRKPGTAREILKDIHNDR